MKDTKSSPIGAAESSAAPVKRMPGEAPPKTATVELEKKIKVKMAAGLTRAQAEECIARQAHFDEHHAAARAAFAAQGRIPSHALKAVRILNGQTRE